MERESTALEELIARFQEDHAVLGRGFHDLAVCLRGADTPKAGNIARRLDEEAGSHMAFEEEDLYPALESLVGPEKVRDMYRQHEVGLGVVRALVEDRNEPMGDARRARLVEDIETMRHHIEDCSGLFELVGRLDPERQRELCRRLLSWRERRPRWTRGWRNEP